MNQELCKIAQTLTTKGQIISFKPGSILQALETFNSEEEFNSAINQISNKLNSELILIKNKLLPLMNEIAQLCKKKVEGMQDTSEITKYNIRAIDIPEFIKEMKANGILKDKRQPMKLGPVGIGLACPPLESIRDYFKSPVNGLEIYINQILSKYKDEDLINLWEKYLGNLSDDNLYIIELFRNPINNVENIILFFVCLDNIRDEKPIGSSVSDENYNTVLPVIHSEIKNLLAIINDNIIADRKIGRLVLSMSPDNYTINVDKELYDKFLENGGSPEVLYGLSLVGEFKLENSFLTDIQTKSEEYKLKWINKVKLEGFNSIPNLVNRYDALYQLVLRKTYEAYIPADLVEYLTCDYNNAQYELRSFVKELPQDKFLDYNYVARMIIGCIMFKNTNFYQFTETMLGYMNLNKTFTQQDAATFASFDLIICYLLEQIETEAL